MASDRDRLTFDVRQQYRSVVAQQGRVMVPADFNEALEIEGEDRREEALDFVGPSGTPDNGYAIGFPAASPPAFDFLVNPGTMYVGGVRVFLFPLADPTKPVTYFHQPDWLDPEPPQSTLPTLEYILLSLREQEIGAVEVANLKDVALGGPDTTQRLRLIQQILRLSTTAETCTAALTLQQTAWNAGGQSFDPVAMRLNSLAKLKAGFDQAGPPPSPCDPVALGGYLGAENQLIRVRISGQDRFVWGFDNSSFLYRVTLSSDNQTLVLDSPPIDSFHFPRVGQAVEVLRTQARLPDGGFIAADTGQVFTLTDTYNPDTQSVKLPSTFTASAGTPQLFLRVWDQELQFVPGTAKTLGATGLQVTLQAPGNVFHVGDFWAFAARPSTPVNVYPPRYLDDFQPPDGPRQWVCPLAVISWSSTTGAPLEDCRNKFDNLVNLTKRKTGASCCTVLVKPEDMTAGVTLQSILDGLKNTASTVCLLPGVYPLAAPIMLGPEHSGLTIEGCHPEVVLQRQSSGLGNFLHGLVILDRADKITLRGLRFQLPPTPFVKTGALLADIPIQVLKSTIGGPEITQIQTAIGVRVLQCADLCVDGCSFDYQVPEVSVFEAGVFAVGACPNLKLRNNRFVHAKGQPPVPAGLGEVRIGFLMTPSFSKTTLKVTPTAISFDALVVPAFLDNGSISGNTFSGLSAAALIYGELSNLRIDSNTARACYAGFQLFSLRFLPNDETLTRFFPIIWDLPFALGGSIGQGFPVPAGSSLTGQLTVKNATFVKPTLPPTTDPRLAGGVRLNTLFTTAIEGAAANLTRKLPTSVIAAANEIDAVLSTGTSGSAFVVWGEPKDALARLVLSANSMRAQTSDERVPVACAMRVARGAVTGNVILNESPSGGKISLVVAADTGIAITGNTMRGQPILPPHLGVAAPLDRWEPLNLIL